MKKFLSVLICICVLLSSLTIGAYAENKESEFSTVKNEYPIIMISGFMCSQLYIDFMGDNEEKVWGPGGNAVKETIRSEWNTAVACAANLFSGEYEQAGKKAGMIAEKALEKLKCKPDGKSVYTLEAYPMDPAKANIKFMLEDNGGKNLYEKSFCKYIATQTDPANVFCFQYDSRFDAVEIAGELNEFIKAVKEYTNSEKVELFCLSYGGLITSTYLYLYGEQNDAAKVVMSVPALGGTNIPARLFRGDICLEDGDLISYLETALESGADFARFFDADRAEWLDKFAGGLSTGLRNVTLYWGSLWSLCTVEDYDELKAEFLDPVKNAQLIKNTDIIHYEIMPSMREILEKRISEGTEIFILCSTGSGLAIGGDCNGDVILPAYAVSGAVCAPLGMRFSDGYTGVKTVCNNEEHHHVSPSMQIDATSAYLPENTWFVDGQYHGMYYYDRYTRDLVVTLLTSDRIKDIYSSLEFPQFEYSDHKYKTVHVSFNNSQSGYVGSDDTALVIKNLSNDSFIKVLSVVAEGMDIDFSAISSSFIAPGESVEIPFEGEIPKVGATVTEITVNYVKIGSITPMCSKNYLFTIRNGDAPEYELDLCENCSNSRLKKVISENLYDLLERFALHKSFECIYDTVAQAVK